MDKRPSSPSSSKIDADAKANQFGSQAVTSDSESVPGTYESGPCGGGKCEMCKEMRPPGQKTIEDSAGKSHDLKLNRVANCKSGNVIYCITCTRCENDDTEPTACQYVGMAQYFRNNFNLDKTNISNKVSRKVYEHFSSEQGHHSVADVRVTILETCSETYDKDEMKESKNRWIEKLGTLHPPGLNTNVSITTGTISANVSNEELQKMLMIMREDMSTMSSKLDTVRAQVQEMERKLSSLESRTNVTSIEGRDE